MTYRLILVDSDSYTSSVLVEDLRQRGFGEVLPVFSTLALPAALEGGQPDVVIFNYQSDQPDGLIICSTIKLMAPGAAIIAIVSPGPPLKAVRAWSKQTHSIDVIVEKPLSDERFFMTLAELLKVKKSSREVADRAERLASLVPEGAMSVVDSGFKTEPELFEAAILFTDIRGSSQLIRDMPHREFFELLNQLLSLQARHISSFEGSVIKYTGDGIMAVFRGMGRSYLALRCALELAALSKDQKMPFGTGVAQGLVLAGLIGDSHHAGQRRQYDVIGATVHLAARLCDMANAGEVIGTKSISMAAKLATPTPRAIASVSIRGFDREIDCVAFNP
ncbi:MAG: adenylate/guanylate cyclase domain-containing response regulator [Pseudomonadota bacterium]